MLRFSANLGFLWRELPLVERIRRAKAAGFDAVEFHYPYDIPARGAVARGADGGRAAGRRHQHAARQRGCRRARPCRRCRGARRRRARPSTRRSTYAKAIGAGFVHVLAGKTG